MADFVAVLKKTLDGLPNPTAETRQRVYERARSTIVSRIDAMNPPPAAAVKAAQLRSLDDAIKTVESSYAPSKPLDPLDELEDVFRSLNGLMNQPTTPVARPATPPAPAAAPPAAITPRPATTPTLPRSPVTDRLPASERAALDRPASDRAPLDRPAAERPRSEPLPRRDVPAAPEPARNGSAPRPLDTAPRPASTGAAMPAAPNRPAAPPAPRPADAAPRPAAPQLPPVRDPSRPLPGAPDRNAAPSQPREAVRPPVQKPLEDFSLEDTDEVGIDTPLAAPRSEPRRAAPVVQERKKSGGGFGKVAAVIVGLAALGAAGYGVWVNKDDFSRLVGLAPADGTTTNPQPAPEDTAQTPPATTPPETAASEPPAAETPPAATPPAAGPPSKLTQRLNDDGSEVEMGPAGGEPAVGEGTSVAAATPPAENPAAPVQTPAPPASAEPAAPEPVPPQDVAAAPPPAEPAVPPANPANPPATPAAVPPPATGGLAVAQKAIFYEERTASSQGSAEPGTTVWSLVQESPGGGKPPEAAIKGVVSIPEKDIGLSLTIRRNADPTLPASHIIEMIFITPDGFAEGSVDNVLRVALKSDEQQPGSPIIGLPAKIGDGFFLVALNNSKAEIDANMNLLQRQNWLDIAVVYKSGRRALVTMEKGVPGEKVFDEAMKAWGVASSG